MRQLRPDLPGRPGAFPPPEPAAMPGHRDHPHIPQNLNVSSICNLHLSLPHCQLRGEARGNVGVGATVLWGGAGAVRVSLGDGRLSVGRGGIRSYQ